MFNIQETLDKYGLSVDQYEQLLNTCADKLDNVIDLDWSEISEKYHLNWNGDTIRKAQQPILLGGAFIREYYMWKNNQTSTTIQDDYDVEIENKIRKLEREKIKFRDERNAWQKQNYNNARFEQKLECLENEIKKFGKVNFEIHDIPQSDGHREMIISLSDLHIGQTFNSFFGTYDTDVAKERLEKYLSAVMKYASLFNVKKAIICALGDELSGNIHKSIAVTNRENVIQQIKIATELISSFCYECTKIFNEVEYYSVVGNHSRIDTKDDALHDERLDDIISWGVGLSLSHINNFKYISNTNVDVGIALVNCCKRKYVLVHGDFDSNNSSGVSNLCMMLDFKPEAIIRGHLHTPSFEEFNGVKMVQSGSLAGSGDNYTIEKRLSGKASQTILICNDDGIECHIPVRLS